MQNYYLIIREEKRKKEKKERGKDDLIHASQIFLQKSLQKCSVQVHIFATVICL